MGGSNSDWLVLLEGVTYSAPDAKTVREWVDLGRVPSHAQVFDPERRMWITQPEFLAHIQPSTLPNSKPPSSAGSRGCAIAAVWTLVFLSACVICAFVENILTARIVIGVVVVGIAVGVTGIVMAIRAPSLKFGPVMGIFWLVSILAAAAIPISYSLDFIDSQKELAIKTAAETAERLRLADTEGWDAYAKGKLALGTGDGQSAERLFALAESSYRNIPQRVSEHERAGKLRVVAIAVQGRTEDAAGLLPSEDGSVKALLQVVSELPNAESVRLSLEPALAEASRRAEELKRERRAIERRLAEEDRQRAEKSNREAEYERSPYDAGYGMGTLFFSEAKTQGPRDGVRIVARGYFNGSTLVRELGFVEADYEEYERGFLKAYDERFN